MAHPIKQVSNLVKAARLSRALNKVTKAPLPIQEPILNVEWAPKQRFNSLEVTSSPNIFKITKDSDLSFLQQAPKRISNAERAGVPRGERNNVVSQRDYPVGTASRFIRKGEIAIMDDKARYPKGFWKLGDYEKIFSNETIQVPDKFSPTGYNTKSKSKRNFYFTEGDPVAEVRLNGNNKLIVKYNSRKNYFGKDLPQEFYDYLEQIKTLPINPNFMNLQSQTTLYPYKKPGILGEKSETKYLKASDIQSKYVYDFRKYLEHLGYDSSKVTDHQMLQLLTDQYRSLTKNMTGKTKGQVFWHEGPEYHEQFDFSHTGENTGNMGAMGPGNYFSSAASAYGKVSQPYLITDIKETPIASESAIQKGLIPRYVSPGVGFNSGYYEYLRLPEEERLKFPAELRDKYEAIISKIKNKVSDTPTESGRLWIDPVLIERSGVAPRLSLRHIEPMEFMIRRNTGIKSLFPHPQTFVRDANGNIVINRDWKDIRVNYKKGGKIKQRSKSDNRV